MKASKLAVVGGLLLGGSALGILAERCSELFLAIPMVGIFLGTAAIGIWAVVRAFLEDRRALRAGMARPRKGFTVRIRADEIEIRAPGLKLRRIPIATIYRAVFVRDDQVDRSRAVVDALTLYWGEDTETVCVPETADGFGELLAWARGNAPFEVHVVNL